MTLFLIIAGLSLACFLSVVFRVLLLHPISMICYGVRDAYFYLIHRRRNECPTGQLIAYTALFGRGKTLSVVHYITSLYRRYDGKKVWDRDRKKFVTQKVHVISNVDLNIPFERLVSLKQVVYVAESFRLKDFENDTLTVTLVLGDEFSVQMNSRSFKSNIDPMFLNTLLTCRHHHITLVYDAQRFGHVDALLRQVTSYVVECHKVWRVMVQRYYDAYELENASNPELIRPLRRRGWFIRNRDYNAYDTLACVGNLSKSVAGGDMLTEAEIMALQCNSGPNTDGMLNPSRKYRRLRKKMGK